MALKIKFDRLDYQEQAVDSISDVFKNISFKANDNRKSNPTFDLESSKGILVDNITKVRESNKVDIGEVSIKDELIVDTLMETGTGKTFTFLESIYRLNRDYGLSKFIILVPSNPIRQGTIKNIKITKEFFVKEYGKQISVFNYSEKTVLNYINASDQNISVLVSTYQSFNKASNNINKSKIEQSLIGRAKSYMQAIAQLRPVIVIDEPHRFEGKQTAKYLKEFNALFTLRFGATFKGDEYKNLIYTLDSVDAFSRGLVKAITVDTVGNENVDNHTIAFTKISGSSQKDYKATIEYKDINSKNKKIVLKKGENLGEKVDIKYLNSYVVEKITKTEVIFANSISLPLGVSESYGVLLDEMQKVIVDTAIKNHFEREEELFKLDIKALCLFFIDRVDKYLTDEGINGELAKLFEKLYLKNLEEVLKRDNLDEDYKKYLLKTKESLNEIHSGYFAKSKKEGDEAEAIELILNKKEELLSFDSDLRFIFSQWALQEGWDNPNVMTLCKLSPSNSKISKLQQIGRGLRLAVDQDGKRITQQDSNFEFVNELCVIVPSTEKNFVESIQDDIYRNSIRGIDKIIKEEILVDNKIVNSIKEACRLLGKLENLGFVLTNANDESIINISKETYENKCDELEILDKCDVGKLKEYFKSFFRISNSIKSRDNTKKTDKEKIKIHQDKFNKFKTLWNSLNYDAILKYDVDSSSIVKKAKENINKHFVITGQDIIVKRDKNVQSRDKHDSERDIIEVKTHSVLTIYDFVKALANNTKLSINTISRVLNEIDKEKFALISQNENLALKKIEEQFLNAIYDTIIYKISYELKEIRTCNTSLTDENGNARKFINRGVLGRKTYTIEHNKIKDLSIYDEDFMEYDSDIEKYTIEESNDKNIVVFGKLPKVNIPTIHGKTYNPDFGYVIKSGSDHKEFYFIVETKGYDHMSKISVQERLKIESAKKFFEKLREKEINIHYEPKLNKDQLSQMIKDLLKK